MAIPATHRAAPAAQAVLDVEVEGPEMHETHDIALTVRDKAILGTLGINVDAVHDDTVRAVRAAMARPKMPSKRSVRFHGKTRVVR